MKPGENECEKITYYLTASLKNERALSRISEHRVLNFSTTPLLLSYYNACMSFLIMAEASSRSSLHR